MLPFLKLAGTPENFRDAQFVIWFGGIAPAELLIVLDKLRITGLSPRNKPQNVTPSHLCASRADPEGSWQLPPRAPAVPSVARGRGCASSTRAHSRSATPSSPRRSRSPSARWRG